MKQTILIAEDEADIRNILRLYLESENYEVLEAADGESAVAAVRNGSPDLVILDIMMPKLDGFAVVRAIRQQSDIPVLILSARNQDNDKILGLNLGADDYIAKPVQRAGDRGTGQGTSAPQRPFPDGSLLRRRADPEPRDPVTVTKDGEPVLLTPTEYKLLSVLMRSPGRIFTRVQLSEAINGEYYENDEQHHDGAYLQAAGKDRGQSPQACPSGHCERIGVPL